MMMVLMLVDHELTITTSDDDGELVGGDLLPLLDDDAGPAGDYHFPSQRF